MAMTRLLERGKQALTLAGARSSLPMLLKLNSALNYLWVGHWMQSRGFRVRKRVDSRERVFEVAADEIREREVLYLEFGVYRGKSIEMWSRLLSCMGSTASSVYRSLGISALRKGISRWMGLFRSSKILVCLSSKVGSAKPFLGASCLRMSNCL